MAEEIEDWENEDTSGTNGGDPEVRPTANVPKPRSDRRHAAIVRRQIGTEGVKRRKAKPYLEVHEIKSGIGAPPEEDAWSEEQVRADDIWDERPADEDEAELSEEEREKRRVAKRKRDAELAWGQRRRRMNLGWTLAGGLTLVVLGVLLGRADRKSKPPAVVVEPDRFESTILLDDTSVASLLTLGREMLPNLTEMLGQADGDPSDAAEVVAGGVHTASLMPEWSRRVGPVSGIKEDGVIGMLANVLEGDAYLVVTGLRDDYSKYVAYFIESEGELRLDWRATVGFSEVLPEEVPGMPRDDSRLMRVVASPSSFYTATFPDTDFACFLVSHLDRERYAWGYVQRDSPAHLRLVGALSAPLTRVTAGRITIVVRKGAEKSLPNQILIEEVIGADWLSVRRNP